MKSRSVATDGVVYVYRDRQLGGYADATAASRGIHTALFLLIETVCAKAH
jgi:hypothetical protein